MITKAEKLAEKRRREIAIIQIGRQQLQMEDAAYRAMLRRVSAPHGDTVDSSADLSPKQRQAVINELQRLGAPRFVHAGKPANFDGMAEEITKVEALLADLKLPWSYADAICRRQTGIARVAWLKKPDHFVGLIAALHVEQKKRRLSARIDVHLKYLGMTDADLEARIRLKTGWRRNVKALESVAERLSVLVQNQEEAERSERA